MSTTHEEFHGCRLCGKRENNHGDNPFFFPDSPAQRSRSLGTWGNRSTIQRAQIPQSSSRRIPVSTRKTCICGCPPDQRRFHPTASRGCLQQAYTTRRELCMCTGRPLTPSSAQSGSCLGAIRAQIQPLPPRCRCSNRLTGPETLLPTKPLLSSGGPAELYQLLINKAPPCYTQSNSRCCNNSPLSVISH